METTLFGSKPGLTGSNVVIGLPYDKTSSAYSGCSKAPFALRGLSRSLGLKQGYAWDLQSRTKCFESIDLSDAGNLAYSAYETQESYFLRCEQTARQIALAGKRIIALGGDHVVTLPILRGIASVHSRFQVIHLDAHTDFQQCKDGDQPTHANFVGFASSLPQIHSWLQLGVRTFARVLPDFPDKLKTTSIHNLSDCLEEGVPVYITIDTDAFDPSIMPGVSHPVPTGLDMRSLDEVLAVIKEKKVSLIGMDWVEYNPEMDLKNQLTGHAVLQGLLNVLTYLS